jgi:hypothetical protein
VSLVYLAVYATAAEVQEPIVALDLVGACAVGVVLLEYAAQACEVQMMEAVHVVYAVDAADDVVKYAEVYAEVYAEAVAEREVVALCYKVCTTPESREQVLAQVVYLLLASQPAVAAAWVQQVLVHLVAGFH